MLEYQLLGIPVLEWIGYVASVIVLVSLSMASIIKLRWYNMVGAGIFSAYGFLIGAYPVGIMNFLIVCANIYNLYKMYQQTEDFKVIEISSDDKMLNHLLDFYSKDIQTFFPDFKSENGQIAMFVLRNMNVAGIFIGTTEGNSLRIDLDYALPQYRDFKVGNYLYEQLKNQLSNNNIKTVYCNSKLDLKYMKEMGFETVGKNGKSIIQKSL